MLELKLAEGWREVTPRQVGLQLLGESDGHLQLLESDLVDSIDFGKVGPIDCPITYDRQRRMAFRYVCEERVGFRDFSQLRAFNLVTGQSFVLHELPLSHWVLWFLKWIEGTEQSPGRFLGLLASDRSSADHLELRHQLFVYLPGASQTLNRPICQDAYHPLDFSQQRKELLFVGAEGVYIVGLRGERLAEFKDVERPSGRGGCFDPSGSSTVAIGGNGLHLWDTYSGECRRLRRQGQYPVWCGNRNALYFSESSSDLFEYDLSSDLSKPLVQVLKSHSKEVSFASSVRLSQNGRYLALSLTGRRLKGVMHSKVDAGGREHVYANQHELCVLDVERKEIWRREGFFKNLCWIEAVSPE